MKQLKIQGKIHNSVVIGESPIFLDEVFVFLAALFPLLELFG